MPKQQRQITHKLDELCRHAKGDVIKLKGLPGLYRLKNAQLKLGFSRCES